MSLAETAELVAELNLKGDFQRKATAAQRQLRGLDKDSSKLKAAFGKMGKGASQAFHTLAKGATVAGVAVLALGGKTLSWAADFEEQLGKINTVAKVTPKELDAIGDSLKGLAESTGTSLDDLSAAYYDLVSAGVDAADAQNVLTQANKLAIGGLSTTAESVDLLTTAINAYGLDAKDAARITDGFAQAIAAGKVTASELAGSFADVAPFAADLGIEIEELQAGYALLTSKGIKAAQAGTYMRSAVVALLNPTAELEKLQSDLNVDFAELARDRGLVYAYEQLRKAAEEAGIPLQKLTGRIEGAAFATNTGGRNFRKYNDELERVKRSSDGAGVAAQQMAERQKGVNASLRRLKETARVTGIEFAEGLLPGAVKGFDAIAAKIKSSRRAIRSFGDTVGSIIKDFFTDEFRSGPDQGSIVKVGSPFSRLAETVSGAFDGIKNLPWGEIKENFGFVTRVAGEALRIFQSLPPEMQGALITLLAANKLTGGLVASGLKDIAGFALKSLTTINAGNVVLNAASVTQPGTPGGPTPVLATTAGLIIAAAAASVGANAALDRVLPPASDQSNRLKPPDSGLLPGWFNPSDISARLAAAVSESIANGFRLIVPDRPALSETMKGVLANIEAVKAKAAIANERHAQLTQISGTGNDLLRDLTDDQARTDAAFQKQGNLTRSQIAVAKLSVNAAQRAIPILGGVRQGVLQTATAVRRQDMTTVVNVTSTVSAVTAENKATFVRASNRVVTS